MSRNKPESPAAEADAGQGWSVIDVWSLLLFFAVILWAVVVKDYVLATAWCMVCLCGCSGLRSGAGGTLGMLAAMCLAVFLGPSLGVRFEGEVTKWIGTTGLANRIISISLMVVMLTVVVSKTFQWLVSLLINRQKTMKGVNRFLGGILGCTQGVAGVFLLVGGLFTIESLKNSESVSQQSSSLQLQVTSASKLDRLVHEVHASRLGEWVEKFNPYEKFPQLNRFHEVKQTVEILIQPDRVQQLLAHPEIARLKSDPKIQIAIRELRDDPEISKVLQGGQSLDSSAVVMLLNHPKVLNLLDQPGFLESIQKSLK